MLRRGSHHLRKGRFSEPGRIYLVTSVTQHRHPLFRDIFLGRILIRELMAEESRGDLESLAFVVMPDHLHWLVQLGNKADLSKCVQRTKSLSARALNQHIRRTGRVWQDGFHDHALRRDEDLVQFARYVIANPLRAQLVDSVRKYSLWDAIWI